MTVALFVVKSNENGAQPRQKLSHTKAQLTPSDTSIPSQTVSVDMPLLQSPDTSTGIPPAASRLSHENVRIQSRAACSRTFAASKACRTNQHALDSGEYRGGLGNPSWRGLRRAEGNAPPVVNGWASIDKVGTRVATLDRHEAVPAKLAHKGKRPRENDDKDLCSVLAGCYRGFQSSAAFSHGTKAAPTSLVGRFLLRQYSTEQIRIWLCMPVQCFVPWNLCGGARGAHYRATTPHLPEISW